jgi:hypothetical protein
MVVNHKRYLLWIMAKLKRLCLEIQICQLEKIILKQELHSELDTNVVQLKIRQLRDTGLAENGKGELCQKVKKVTQKSR